MRVRVRYFASIREILGKGEAEVEVLEGSTVGELVERFKERHGGLGGRRLLVAVNGEYADPKTVLGEGDEVALFPHVSGG
ncbi:MAG: molybdopterin converting factor subunit 1 [Candidatus Bathyarchaeota archaeon]|jgi:molybdopterin converting factor subunit 1